MTPSNPLVSVIVCFYNAEQFIREAIESIRAQTYDHWELLLVDDGSADASGDIARAYLADEPERVHYLEHPGHENRGISASRNLGIRHASGKYVAFLDADDVWLPHKLECQVEILDSQPAAAMLYGNTLYWYSWTGHAADRGRDFLPNLGVQPGTLFPPPTLLPSMLSGTTAEPCICSILIRRDILDTIQFEASFKHLYEDQVFYAKMFLQVPVYVSGECWDRYRQHRASICAVAGRAGDHIQARLVFLDWLKNYMAENELGDPQVLAQIRRQVWIYQHYNRALATRLPPLSLDLWRRAKKWVVKMEQVLVPAAFRR